VETVQGVLRRRFEENFQKLLMKLPSNFIKIRFSIGKAN